MSLHKLTAGSGYDYLTRQVAAMDSTEKGHASLASYYSGTGETPGQWIGSGLDGIDGLEVGDIVTESQMKSLYGFGLHPLADERLEALDSSASPRDRERAQNLGTPFKVFAADVPPFRVEVARRLAELNEANGHAPGAAVSIDDRARVRSDVAAEYFERDHSRLPSDARELASAVARYSRPKTSAVAGFDLTFSPVKSVSTLWAVSSPQVAAVIELSHQAAVKDALAFIEREALFTRTGTHGVRQVDVRGLVGAAFTHRDSRAGDPDLHTHIAVANKVQTEADGRWLSIDGRVLYKATVASSEVYNSALERHLRTRLGLHFSERPNQDRTKRPVREVVGVDPRLNAYWSRRRQSVETRLDELSAAFQAAHGRPPTPVESVRLAQQATLETRPEKHAPRSLDDQRREWSAQAIQILGSRDAVEGMVRGSLGPERQPGSSSVERMNDQRAWLDVAAQTVVSEVESRRSTWQRWHLIAEAERQTRRAGIPAADLDRVVTTLIEKSLGLSHRISTDTDPTQDPPELLRSDGSSVYSVAGADLFTSQRLINAEKRITDAAGTTGGRTVPDEVVELAVLESSALGVDLNAGQVAMVSGMASSGARVQLGIAAAGTGKTTTMRVLTRAWEESGGNVIGLAPSAAAASVLRQQTGSASDTLAKLIDLVDRNVHAELIDSIGPATLVIIDEAAMADTLSLDSAISFTLARGASVRLVGDDQQLSSIGAGGVLRDIAAAQPVHRLAELMRFEDPAEAAATLALRDGKVEAAGYYADNGRAHAGNSATALNQQFTAWEVDRFAGMDSLMLAPTRDLVAQLNHRARSSLLARRAVDRGAEVLLRDGNRASRGDIVITRKNDRQLRLSASDWVKNGDRWLVLNVNPEGMDVKHQQSGLRISLPQAYLEQHTELGYASTVHTAQGVSADTTHGLVLGSETRQQLYTMATRGRRENHLYVVVEADGDPHSLVRPTAVAPPTVGEVLETIIMRDGSPKSATTTARESTDVALQLNTAVDRFDDAVHALSHSTVGADRRAHVEAQAEILEPGLTQEPAWPSLASALSMRDADGIDSVETLADAIAVGELESAADRAAVLTHRLGDLTASTQAMSPLPWLPGIPVQLREHPQHGPYLAARAERITRLCSQVRTEFEPSASPWCVRRAPTVADPLSKEVAVWRAATGVADDDMRPTGPRQDQPAAAAYQRSLDRRLGNAAVPALQEWGDKLAQIHPRVDPFTPLLAERLAALNRAGLPAATILSRAVAEGPLPDEHIPAAIWWRVVRQVSPAVSADQISGDERVTPVWEGQLELHLGSSGAAAVLTSPWWPTLVATVEQAHQRGWPIQELLTVGTTTETEDLDLAQAMIWRISIAADPPPEWEPTPDHLVPPADLEEARSEASPEVVPQGSSALQRLTDAARQRHLMAPHEPSRAELDRLLERVWGVSTSPVSVTRIDQVNELTAQYFQRNFAGSWAQLNLFQRLGIELGGDIRFRPGYAPKGWTTLVDHLRVMGYRDKELLAAGVAKVASNGRLIDRFRDRSMLPVIRENRVIGFVGRRDPRVTTPEAGPKYLNTPDTVRFHKGAQLFGVSDDIMSHGSVPVLVEGPLDALAVTTASAGAFVGVAPLGTSLTPEQAAELVRIESRPIIATDGDVAGRVAAERAHWLLAPHQVSARFVAFEHGMDPAAELKRGGPARLVSKLQLAGDLASELVAERRTNISDPAELRSEVSRVIASSRAEDWPGLIADAIAESGMEDRVASLVATEARRFTDDPDRYSTDQLSRAAQVRARLEKQSEARPKDRWHKVGVELDPRLVAADEWYLVAGVLQRLDESGQDPIAIAEESLRVEPLGDNPARELESRLARHLPKPHLSTQFTAESSEESEVDPPRAVPHRQAHARRGVSADDHRKC